MAKAEIERDIGEMRACVSNIKLMLQTSHENDVNLFERLGKVEQQLAASVTHRAALEKRIDEICAEREKERDRELTRNNTKIGLVALAVTIINIVIGVVLNH